jgi:glycosyltransferase involved in cell wall biosynthesis
VPERRRVLIALDLPLGEQSGESEYVRGTAKSLRFTGHGLGFDLAVAAVSSTDMAGHHAGHRDDLAGVKYFPVRLEGAPRFVRQESGRDPLYAHLDAADLDNVQRRLHAGLARAVHAFEPDIVHVHHALLLVPAAAVLGAIYSVPFVVTAHGTDTKTVATDRRYADIVGPSLRRASGVTAVSPEVRRELGELFGAAVEREVAVVPGGVDTDYYIPGSDPGTLALDLEHDLFGRSVVLFVGALTRQKGVDVLLEAAESLPELRFCLIGSTTADPSFGNWVQQRAEELNNVVLLGRVGDEEKLQWYRRAQVLVMPSRGEAFGLVALEAMACGIPVVVSRSSAMEQVVSDGVNGYLVEPGRPELVARRIREIIEDPSYGSMRAEARATIDDGYGWSTVAAKLHPVYTRALGPAQPFAFR